MPKTPAAAKKIVERLEQQRRAIYRRAEKQLEPLRKAAARKLKALQDRLCRQAKLDEALEVRKLRMRVMGVQPDPGYVRAKASDIGKSFLYLVVGSHAGSLWGSGVYTTDSKLAKAAVHAGLVNVGQRAVVRVRIVPGQGQYVGSSANGVTSYGYGSWPVSFTLEKP
ncbi:MAG: hypothetical protein KC503_24200 [Myxococcales bacterium]|nr:hypothetical protein [Myxococcales bacterium]